MDKSIMFWNIMSSKYDKQVNAKFAQAYNATIEKTKGYLKPTDIVLDFACGTGITTIELAKIVKEIYAIDTSKKMIDIAKSKSATNDINNIKYGEFDIMNENLKTSSFDVILAFNILYFLEDIESNLIRINELLKPEGVFISVTDCLGEKRTIMSKLQDLLCKIKIIPYMRQFKMIELEEIIKISGFSIIESENLNEVPPNYYIVAKKDGK